MSQAAISIVVAFITGGLSLIGVILTVRQSAKKQDENIRTSIALMQKDIETLVSDVRKVTDLASRLPVLEEKVANIESRLTKLEAHS